ncbi:MAG: NAD(P)H-hydrate epimerase [Nitrososphaerota archaeon]
MGEGTIAHSRRYRSFEIGVIDENSSYLGVDRRILMENAGAAVARVVEREAPSLSTAKILVVAGPGNNGGDAFVAARHLASRAARVSVVLLARPEQIKTHEASANWEALTRMRRSVELHPAGTLEELQPLRRLFEEADIILDGIFGTGIRGEVREPYRTAINLINSARALKVSIDVPSGLDPDTGGHTIAVRPDVTVTLHGPKSFMDMPAELIGRVYVEPIGAPPDAETIAGPGDLVHALSRLRRPSTAIVEGEGVEAEGALEALRMIGVEAGVGASGGWLAVRAGGVTVSDRVVETGGGRFALVRWAHEGGGEDALSLARALKSPVYLVGGWDSISDSVYLKSNWIEPPIESGYVLGVAASLSAIFLESGVEPIYALGAACYAARRPMSGGGGGDRQAYLERLGQLLSRR